MQRFLVMATMVCSLAGCAIYDDVMGRDEEGAAPRLSPEDAARVTELFIATGRYGVMLGQAREILRLPETKMGQGETTGSDATDPLQELRGIAALQARTARELSGDALAACNRATVPLSVRQLGCEISRTLPAGMLQPVSLPLANVARRDEELGAFVMRWWNAACAIAPKAAEGEPHACSIE